MIIKQLESRPVPGVSCLQEFYWTFPDGSLEQHEAFEVAKDFVSIDADDGMKRNNQVGCSLFSQTLLQNDDGEWFCLMYDAIHPIAEAKAAGVSRRALVAIGIAPAGCPHDQLVNKLIEKGAFCTVSRQGEYDAATFIVMGRRLIAIGCNEAWDRMIEAGVIDTNGDFIPDANLSAFDGYARTIASVQEFLMEATC